jgi:hypothetical protein
MCGAKGVAVKGWVGWGEKRTSVGAQLMTFYVIVSIDEE